MAVSVPEEYEEEFDAKRYLSIYYNEVDPLRNIHVLEGLHKLFSNGTSGLKILEIGCGPALAYQISAAPQASEIVMAELVECNRDALRQWLDRDPSAHDWKPFIRHVVQTLEGKGEEEVGKREEQLRAAVKAVIPCDATKDPIVPPEYEGPYDVVMTMAVLGAVCETEADYTAAFVRLSKLLKPGGTLVGNIYITEGLDTPTVSYSLGGSSFVTRSLSENSLLVSLEKAGFSNVQLRKSTPIMKTALLQQGATYFGAVFLTAINAVE